MRCRLVTRSSDGRQFLVLSECGSLYECSPIELLPHEPEGKTYFFMHYDLEFLEG